MKYKLIASHKLTVKDARIIDRLYSCFDCIFDYIKNFILYLVYISSISCMH